MKIGVIGDIHYPYRSDSKAEYFMRWFSEENIDIILCTGDLNDKVILDSLNDIAKTYCVRGNTDYLNLPKEISLDIEGWEIYLFHSDEIRPRGDISKLYRKAKEKGADILIFGHTHIPFFTYIDGVYFLNPGSATGVISGEGIVPPKSAAILELDREKINVRFKSYGI